MEPVQNAGGCFMPPEGYFQRVREICDEYDVLHDLRRGDLRLGPARRVVRRHALRLPARHHHHRQGADQRLRPDGGGDRLRPRRGAVHAGHQSFTHGFTFAGHPICVRGRAGQPRRDGARGRARERPQQRGAVPRDARVAARHPDRRRRARRRATSTPSSWSRTRTPTSSGPTRSPRPCCAASCPGSCTAAG